MGRKLYVLLDKTDDIACDNGGETLIDWDGPLVLHASKFWALGNPYGAPYRVAEFEEVATGSANSA